MTSVTPQKTPLAERSPAELAAFIEEQRTAYDAFQGRGLNLADRLLQLPTTVKDADGVDVRNYGGLNGLRQLREMFAELLWVEPEQVVAGGNSSLTMMHDTLVQLLLHGPVDGQPWSRQDTIRFICPVPGYDRHFTMLASYGIEMVTVDMLEDGPDVDAIESLVASDPSIVGMWIVPTYANPDFKILWDNAYAFHHLTEDEAKSVDILSLASAAGHPERPIMFASTSKITYAGAGVAVLAASAANVQWYLKHIQFASIGPDKVNQLRHVEFFGSAQGVRDHMLKHRAILAPKFAAVDEALTSTLAGLGVASWTRPTGGYFVSLDVLDGCATRVVQLAKGAGIALTPAGASFPHGKDPRDRNIRLAPSFPELEEVRTAMAGVATCVALAAAEHLVATGGESAAVHGNPEGA